MDMDTQTRPRPLAREGVRATAPARRRQYYGAVRCTACNTPHVHTCNRACAETCACARSSNCDIAYLGQCTRAHWQPCMCKHPRACALADFTAVQVYTRTCGERSNAPVNSQHWRIKPRAITYVCNGVRSRVYTRSACRLRQMCACALVQRLSVWTCTPGQLQRCNNTTYPHENLACTRRNMLGVCNYPLPVAPGTS